jgi:peptidoglycan/LPS O-acetylase OafA/YrhL
MDSLKRMEPGATVQIAPNPHVEHVPDALLPPPGNPRFPSFDGLRACAALAILFGHAAFLSGYTVLGHLGPWTTDLYVGVTVFFVISGFLLYRPFVSADLEHRAAPHTPRFYRRRLLRIVPAYWVALTIVGLIPGLAPHLFDHWAKYYFFLQVYSPSPDGIGPAWSLCVEMSFYLLIPFYALAMRRLMRNATAGRRIRVELVVLLVLGILSAIDKEIWIQSNGTAPMVISALPQYLLWFVLGMGLAVVSAWARATQAHVPVLAGIARHPGWCWLAALAVFVLYGAFTDVPADGLSWTQDQQMMQYLLQALIAFLFVLPAVFTRPDGRGGVPGRFLTTRGVAWLGLVSYGIYLWHVPVMSYAFNHGWVDAVHPSARFLTYLGIALGITIPIAAISYYVVERPALRFKEPRRPAAMPSPSGEAVPSPPGDPVPSPGPST